MIVEFDINFEYNLTCESEGTQPLTSVVWTDYKFETISSQFLTITNELLSESSSEDKIFYCVAENQAGRDIRSVTLRLNITLMDISDVESQLQNQSEISNEQSQLVSVVVTVLSSAVQDESELIQVANTFEALVSKTLNNTMLFDEETAIPLLRAASVIIDKSQMLNTSVNISDSVSSNSCHILLNSCSVPRPHTILYSRARPPDLEWSG